MPINKIAIQMDSIEKIDLEFDTSYLLIMEAQKRGYEIFYFNPIDLQFNQGIIQAWGFFIEVINDINNHFKYISKKKELLNLADFNVVLIRQDPPFDMNYISSTYILEKLPSSTIVLNNPASIRNAAEKFYPYKLSICRY